MIDHEPHEPHERAVDGLGSRAAESGSGQGPDRDRSGALAISHPFVWIVWFVVQTFSAAVKPQNTRFNPSHSCTTGTDVYAPPKALWRLGLRIERDQETRGHVLEADRADEIDDLRVAKPGPESGANALLHPQHADGQFQQVGRQAGLVADLWGSLASSATRLTRAMVRSPFRLMPQAAYELPG